MARQTSIFQSAIEGDDGRVDAGYLGLFVVMCTMMGAAFALVIFGGLSIYRKPDDAAEIIAAVGNAMMLCGSAFAASAAAVGAFRMGDKPRAGTTTTSVTATEKTVAATPGG